MKKILFAEDVRKVCIDYNLYTNGDNQSYECLLEFVGVMGKDFTDNTLYYIAQDILDHSVTSIGLGYLCYLLNREVRFIDEKYL